MSDLEELEKMVEELREAVQSHIDYSAKSRHDIRNHLEVLALAQKNQAQQMDAFFVRAEGLVKTYEDLGATVRVGMGVNKLLSGLAKFGFIGISFAAIARWVLDYFTPGGVP